MYLLMKWAKMYEQCDIYIFFSSLRIEYGFS